MSISTHALSVCCSGVHRKSPETRDYKVTIERQKANVGLGKQRCCGAECYKKEKASVRLLSMATEVPLELHFLVWKYAEINLLYAG